MGMRVAAVSLMCQDYRVFSAMQMAGTPCPYDGMIGEEAALAWEANPNKAPEDTENRSRNNSNCQARGGKCE